MASGSIHISHIQKNGTKITANLSQSGGALTLHQKLKSVFKGFVGSNERMAETYPSEDRSTALEKRVVHFTDVEYLADGTGKKLSIHFKFTRSGRDATAHANPSLVGVSITEIMNVVPNKDQLQQD